MSALNINKIKDSKYALSKMEGEKLAKEYLKIRPLLGQG